MKKESFATLSLTELEERLERAENEHKRLSFAHTISPIENPMRLRGARRLIASVKTEIRKREIQVSHEKES